MCDDERMEELIQDKVQTALKENNDQLLKNIEGMINKISVNPVSSCSDIQETAKLKRRSNEEQFKHNSKVMAKLEDINVSLASDDVVRATALVTEAKDLIKRRQKLIQLADGSEFGWRLVAECEANPIACGSEDEKRIFKAEARANRKAKSDKNKKARVRSAPYQRRRVSSSDQASSQPQRVWGSSGQNQRSGACYLCGEFGHWKADCQQNRRSNNKKSFSNCHSYYEKNLNRNVVENGPCVRIESTCTQICIDTNAHVESHVCEEASVLKPGGHSDDSLADSGMSYSCIDKCEIPCSLEKEITQISKNVLSPKGRLKESLENWVEITSDKYILDVVENGYKLPFRDTPTDIFLKNNKSSRDNPGFVESEISSLLEKGVISEVQEKPRIVNPLTVAYSKTGKPRLVLDCRHINPFLHLFKIKFEDIKIAQQMFDNSSYVYTFDLKSAYHHIEIFSKHRTFLGFAWTSEGKTRYYLFNVLPFGKSTAGHIFTKVLRCAVKYWPTLGHNVVRFLDDGIGGNTDFQLSRMSSLFIQKSLNMLGFLIAQEKCNWLPAQNASWLGLDLDFQSNCFFISSERIKRLESSIDALTFILRVDNTRIVPVRSFASVVGQVISLLSVMGTVVCRKTRYSHKCIDSRFGWNSKVWVTDKAFQELLFWRENASVINAKGKNWKEKLVVDAVVYSDASKLGYRGFIEFTDTVVSKETNTGSKYAKMYIGMKDSSSPDVELKSKEYFVLECKSCVDSNLSSPEEDTPQSPDVDFSNFVSGSGFEQSGRGKRLK